MGKHSYPCGFRLIATHVYAGPCWAQPIQGSTLNCFLLATHKCLNDGWEKAMLLLRLFMYTNKSWQHRIPHHNLIVGLYNLPNTVMDVCCAKVWWNTCELPCFVHTNNSYNSCQIWVLVYGCKFVLESSINFALPCLCYMKSKVRHAAKARDISQVLYQHRGHFVFHIAHVAKLEHIHYRIYNFSDSNK